MLNPGDEIDIWVVEKALGQGGMGSVYRCHNREARRILAAIKVLDASVSKVPSAKARFVREAEILYRLDHPGIVKVRNVRMELATPYLEMEYVDGVRLDAGLDRGPMSAAQALPIFKQVADALNYLHAQGVRHRDLKPSNILIQPNGVVKLVDFGIASEADGSTITEQGQTFGSVSYAPPEWLDPDTLDAVKWDIYSAGVVFWEVLTGQQAFPMSGLGTLSQQVVRMIAVKQRQPPLDPGAHLPRGLRALIREMTDPYAENRIGDAATVRARLDTIDLDDIDSSTPPPRPPPPAETVFTDGEAPARPAGATVIPHLDDLAEDTWTETTRDPGPAAPAPAPPTTPPPRPAPPSRLPWLLMGGATVGIGGAALAVAGFFLLRAPETRDVVVEVTAPGVPYALRLDGAEGTRTGDTFTFPAVHAGDHPLVVSVGEGCTAAAGEPAWCVRTEAPLAVERDREPLRHALTVAAPAPRVIQATAAALDPGTALIARVDGGEPVAGTAAGLSLSLSPGRHTLVVSGPTCPGDCACDAPCWTGPIEVAPGADPLAFPVPLAAKAVVTPPAEIPSAPKIRRGRIVTNAAFAAWLVTHADWAPDAALASGRATSGYLSGWSGISPPEQSATTGFRCRG